MMFPVFTRSERRGELLDKGGLGHVSGSSLAISPSRMVLQYANHLTLVNRVLSVIERTVLHK